MAWQSSGRTLVELLDNMRSAGLIKSQRVYDAMAAVDRSAYCPRGDPYEDVPQGIGFNVTLSAPHMHAHAASLLEDRLAPGARVLDVGSGSGYLTAIFALLVGESGVAVGIDHIPELVERSRKSLENSNPGLLSSGRVKLVSGDGREGYAAAGPYDAIHVGAAAPTLPQALVDQLKPLGRMVIPVGPQDGDQGFWKIEKDAQGRVTKEKLFGVRYVPLCSREEQLGPRW